MLSYKLSLQLGILLIDSSSRKIEFGFAEDEVFLIREKLDPDYNADTLTYFIKKSFDKFGIDFKEIEYVSLSNGPGSFTGLRIGCAIAKGICFAIGSKLIEIPTLDVIANKQSEIAKFGEPPEYDGRKIISLIFSNTKNREFYFCEYEIEQGRLKRISDYKIDLLENIISEDIDFIINEKIDLGIQSRFHKIIKDVSGISNLDSQYNLTQYYIQNSLFSDYRTSEPFYMKDFVPKI